MSGGLLAQAAAHEIGRPLSTEETERLQQRHGVVYRELMPERRPLPGAIDLLRHLRQGKIKHGVATSGRKQDAKVSLDALELPADMVVVDRDDVTRAKPEPDLFLACQARLGVKPEECYVIGDAVWDLLAAKRAAMLGVGLLSGGYGQEELYQAGAYRVYSNPAELLGSIYQLGLRAS
jgi:HAD superfamily hydrolase (TIGR01509 family)